MKNLSVADSLLWQCHVCSEKFSSHDGGLCSRCHRAVCLWHIRLRNSRTLRAARHKAIICTACAGPAASQPWLLGAPLLRRLLDVITHAVAAWRTRGPSQPPRA
ncbi:MAG: hypothetical protein DMD91_00660 [Candidatus Rokuibacteriota bacterium]|nr:MAG: hypothetical protein DMD91_00660 [Candidatus Rokubacteria bacterium]